jgi:CDP-diacylglycerol pyrophosphatase
MSWMLGLCVAGSTLHAADRDALREIVQEQCAVHWRDAHDPAPCESIGDDYAVLADRKGGGHFLLIPTRTLTGIEAPQAYAPGAPNYFQGAWDARSHLAQATHQPLTRTAVALATNPRHSRSQDQLHIHIECIRPIVARSLRGSAADVGAHWAPIRVLAFPFQALRIMGEGLGQTNPLQLLVNALPGAKESIEEYSLIVVGMQFREGPGFIVLAGTQLPGELLLDSNCAAAEMS